MFKVTYNSCLENSPPDFDVATRQEEFPLDKGSHRMELIFKGQRPLYLHLVRQEGATSPLGHGQVVEMNPGAIDHPHVIIPESWKECQITEFADERRVLLAIHRAPESPAKLLAGYGNPNFIAYYIAVIRERR